MKRFPKALIKRSSLEKKAMLDIWFARLSNLSQVGLLILAVFGYFYTVVPVYEKSLLDEEIAKKELQLHALQIKLDEIYAANRMEVIKSFIIKATYKCAGLNKLPKNGAEIFTGKHKSLIQEFGEVFEIDMKECLEDTLTKSGKIKESLKVEDFNKLSQKVKTIGNNLNNLKLELRNKFYALPEKAVSNPEILAPLRQDSIFYRMLEITKSNMTEKEYQSKTFEAKINQGLFDISGEFRDAIYKEIGSLKEVQ